MRLERKLQVPVYQKDERFYFLQKSQEGPVNIPLGTCSMLALGLYKNALDYEILHAACAAEFWLRTKLAGMVLHFLVLALALLNADHVFHLSLASGNECLAASALEWKGALSNYSMPALPFIAGLFFSPMGLD